MISSQSERSSPSSAPTFSAIPARIDLDRATAPSPKHRRKWLLIAGFFVVIAVGVTLRLYHSGSSGIGQDENLYREYVDSLSRYGFTAYPEIAEHYVERQQALPGAILPPTRFLYIFSGYLWVHATGAETLTALRHVSCLFSILMLFASAGFATRLGGWKIGLGIVALMSCAPTQIHMSQHGLIDGFFAFWATLCLWFLWENLRRPHSAFWLTLYTVGLALLVLTKENAMFAYLGLLALLGTNRWLRFGTITPALLGLTIIGPLIGVTTLVFLCGGANTFYDTYLLLVSKASVLPYAVATGDGPWYRYLVDLLLMSPIVFLLAWGGVFRLRLAEKEPLYLLVFVAASYLLMCNIRYGMNLRYTNMWDMPLRYLALLAVYRIAPSVRPYRDLVITAAVSLICLVDLRQYYIFFVQYGLHELVTSGLLHALRILK